LSGSTLANIAQEIETQSWHINLPIIINPLFMREVIEVTSSIQNIQEFASRFSF
jgi:hypothetical protein